MIHAGHFPEGALDLEPESQGTLNLCPYRGRGKHPISRRRNGRIRITPSAVQERDRPARIVVWFRAALIAVSLFDRAAPGESAEKALDEPERPGYLYWTAKAERAERALVDDPVRHRRHILAELWSVGYLNTEYDQ